MCGRPDRRNNGPMQSGGLRHSQILWSPSKRPLLLLRSHLGQSNKLVSCGAHLHHKSGLDFAQTRLDEGGHCSLSSSLSSPLMIQKLMPFSRGERYHVHNAKRLKNTGGGYLLQITAANHSRLLFFQVKCHVF